MGSLQTGTETPAFSLTGTDGRHHSYPEALARGPFLIAFFKVDCPTCQYAFPFLERLYQQFRKHGVQIWAISQDDAKDSRDFASEFEVTFPILIDDHPYDVSDAYGLKHVPTLFLVNSEGRVELTSDGFDKRDLLAIQQWFAKYFSSNLPALFLPTEGVPEFKPG